jgi:hypothetical protein
MAATSRVLCAVAWMSAATACSTVPVARSVASTPASTAIAVGPDATMRNADLVDFGRFPALAPADTDKSYFIPAVEIVTFQVLLNQFDRHFVDEEVYSSDGSSIRDNLHSSWVVDHDPFATNQVFHPYAGSMYFGFARSAGLGFWESFAYTFIGSALWEVGGETGPPSLNDQITTGVSGSFLGEALFRIAGGILVTADGEEPGFFQEFVAALVSPPSFVNRHTFGDRFKNTFPTDDPAVYSRLSLEGRNNLRVNDGGIGRNLPQNELVARFVIDYGLPGRPGYHYDEPFDYFHFDVDVTSGGEATIEDLNARGLLFGAAYGSNDDRGVWGLFGNYSYFAPEVFRVSTTALSVGTIGQWWMSNDVALQGTALGGVGYGASGTLASNEVDRDYHYGVVPQGTLGMRLIFGSLATFELQGRDFYISGVASDDHGHGHENIAALQSALTFRVFERQTIGLQVDFARRDAPYSSIPSRRQTVGTASLVYSYVFGNTQKRQGAVEWREGHGR